MSSTTTYCINHPKTETLLRCIKCGNPVCLKCVVRTPVGYRCKQCSNAQFAGYYNATSRDHVIAAVVGTIVSIIGGALALAIGSFFWLAIIFYAPAAGGVIAEIIRWSIQRRRAKYIWLVACASFVIGAFLAGGALPFILIALTAIGNPRMLGSIALSGIFGFLFNIGLWIYIIMGVGTVYVRLKS
jgi:hypothetical protein